LISVGAMDPDLQALIIGSKVAETDRETGIDEQIAGVEIRAVPSSETIISKDRTTVDGRKSFR
jgi:hypothetical protein